MKLNNVNFYGYERAVFDDCYDLIRDTDYKHMEILNLWFMIITAVYLFFSWQNNYGMSSANAPMFLVFLILEIGLYVWLLFGKRLNGWRVRVIVYYDIALLLAFGIVCSISKPYMAATMFPVVLAIVALSFVDTFWGMLILLALGVGAFITSSYLVKPGSIMNQDIFNVLTVFILSMILHYMFQKARMKQFVTFRESERMQQELEIRSSFDALTSLLNRARFFSVAREVLARGGDDLIVMALMDLDKFKQINDTLGHQVGDKVIQIAGRTVMDVIGIEYGDKWSFPERAVRDKLSFAGRLGGDEFVVLVRGLGSIDEANELFKKVLAALNSTTMEGLDCIQASIGLTVVSHNEVDVDKAYTRADEALYASKEAGRNCISVSAGM